MASLVIVVAVFLGNVASAITETIVTPTPGLGYGKCADVIALAIWAYSLKG
ncbi:MAG: hypothetical protein ACREHG_02580 [Candidatus Saccharimonadales bacterium]